MKKIPLLEAILKILVHFVIVEYSMYFTQAINQKMAADYADLNPPKTHPGKEFFLHSNQK
jgi:hypothetical protein